MQDVQSTNWKQEPWVWVMISIPLAAVIMGVVAAWLAISTWSGLVVDDYYQQGKHINRVLARDNNTSWEPESGQTLFDFATDSFDAAALKGRRENGAATIVASDTAAYWFERGLRLDRAELRDEAARAYARALTIDDEHVNARVNLGRLMHAARDYGAAEALYRRALELHPDHAIAAFNLGVVLEDQGAIDAAIESYQRAVNTDPALPDAHYNLARLYEWRGERRLAARHMSRFRTLSHDES